MNLYLLKKVIVSLVCGLGCSSLLTYSSEIFATSQPQNITNKANKWSDRTQRKSYGVTIANLLHWIPTEGPCDLCDGYYQQSTTILKPKPPADVTIHIRAQGPTTFRKEGVSVLQKNVVVSEPGRTVRADKAYIYRQHNKIIRITLVGNVQFSQYGLRIVGSRATLYPLTHRVVIYDATYYVLETPQNPLDKKQTFDAFGIAAKAEHTSDDILKLWNATYSTCSPLNPSWALKARYLQLNKKIGKGYGKHIVLRFKHIPVLYVPYYSFATDKRRKSGFLAPSVYYNKQNGSQINAPIYWNIAPNVDMLLTPTYFTKRGFQLTTYLRYLTYTSWGWFYASVLPYDNTFRLYRNNTILQYTNDPRFPLYLAALEKMSNTRGLFAFRNTTLINDRLSSDIILNYVTDPYYFRDIGTDISFIQTNQLQNQIDLQYIGMHWNVITFLQAYQTLHLIDQSTEPVTNQYSRLPEIDVTGDYPNLIGNFGISLGMQAVNFVYNSSFPPFTNQLPIGQRFHLRPGFSLPFYWAGGFLIPQVFVDNTSYTVYQPTPAANMTRPFLSASRTLPIVDVDGGLYFDKYWGTSHHIIQTLEPRVFYLYVPFLNQDGYPNFDTMLLPFSFEQLFALNRFTGYDRLDNANQLSFALTSRLMDGDTGRQILRADIGVIEYFTTPRVNLFNSSLTPTAVGDSFSPLASRVTLYPTDNWSFIGNIAWNMRLNRINNGGATVVYSAAHSRIASVGYEFVRDIGTSPLNFLELDRNTEYFHLGLAWPITRRWSTLGYWYYNINRKRSESYYIGTEFNTCCYAIRFVVDRSYTGTLFTSPSNAFTNQFKTTYFVQIELKGLGSYSNNNATSLLVSTLPGYRDIFN